jgi:hypothetical protein
LAQPTHSGVVNRPGAQCASTDPHHYKAHCRCDVTRYTIPNFGHLYQVQASLPQVVDEFVQWLTSHGVPPSSTSHSR